MPPETKEPKEAKAPPRPPEDAPAPPPPAPPRRNFVRTLINACVAVILVGAAAGGVWYGWRLLDAADARVRRGGPTIDLTDIRAVKWIDKGQFYLIRVSPTIELDATRSQGDLAEFQLIINARNAEIRDRIGEKISELPEIEIKSNGFKQLLKALVTRQINEQVFNREVVVTNVWIKDAPVIELGSP